MALFFKSKFLKDVDNVISESTRAKGDFQRAQVGFKIHRLEMELEDRILELNKMIELMRAAMKNMQIAKARLDDVSKKVQKKQGNLDALGEDRKFAVGLFEKHHSEFEIAKRQVDRYEKKFGTMDDLVSAKQRITVAIHNL